MLSPGQYYKDVPRDPAKNYSFRIDLINRAKGDKKFQESVRAACAIDILFFINVFVVQYNPNTIGDGSSQFGPFITWEEFQDDIIFELLACIDPATRESVLIEKSREMGISWLCLIIMVWRMLFAPMEKYLCISRNEEAVDKPGDSDSLFWKIDFILEHLPDWLKGTVKRRKRLFVSERTGSSIVGQASTGKAGVGGRATAMFIDEFSQIAEDYAVLQRTANTTGSRIFNGTHVGAGTAFYELSQRVDWRIIRIHWTQHPDKKKGLYRWDPEKNRIEVLDKTYQFPIDYQFVREAKPTGGPYPGLRSPWYDKKCREITSTRGVAMDLDIDPHGASGQYFEPMLIQTLIRKDACEPYWEGDILYDPDTADPVKLIRKKGGRVKLWLNLTYDGTPPRAMYGAGADIAAGTGATPSCFTIGNAETGEKVLEYADHNIQPDEFAKVCVALCRLFKNDAGDGAMFAWEMAGSMGAAFTKKVIELRYTRVYYRRDELEIASDISDKPGWYPGTKPTGVLLSDYHVALATGHFVNRSEAALKECLAFTWTARGIEHATMNNKFAKENPADARENHGDRVIADALARKMMKGFEKKVEAKKEAPRFHPGSLAGRMLLHHNKPQRVGWLQR